MGRVKKSLHQKTSKRKSVKEAILHGLPYKSCYTGKEVSAKLTGKDCNCRQKCFIKINDNEQHFILTEFLNLTSKDLQDLHLQRLIEAREVKQRRSRKGTGETKAATFKYFVVYSNGTKTNVCQKAFISLHAISKKRVYRLTKLLLAGKTPKDMRGKNPCKNKISEEILKTIDDHIRSFPSKISHYAGKEITYLDARLNILQMHELFVKRYASLNIKYDFYRKYFFENFNFRFGRPQVDVCSKCEQLNCKIKSSTLCESAKKAAVAELLIHKKRSKKFYNSMTEAKEKFSTNDDIGILCFDFMQNLPLPAIPVQEVFYMRQLWVNIFCIHDVKTDRCTIYLYHEGQANKGANEVASFLYDYVKNFLPTNVTKLYLFADSCPGQNRNHTLLRFCAGLTASGRFHKIDYKFPERGHSYLPCDRDFGVFKKKIKKSDRIYIPKDYVKIICNAKKNVEVKVVETSHILNFDSWWPQYFKKTVNSLETSSIDTPRQGKQSLMPTRFKHFEFSSENKGVIVGRPYIDSCVKHTFIVGKPALSNFSMPVSPAYIDNLVPINEKKLQDIRKLLVYVQHKKKAVRFYEELMTWKSK